MKFVAFFVTSLILHHVLCATVSANSPGSGRKTQHLSLPPCAIARPPAPGTYYQQQGLEGVGIRRPPLPQLGLWPKPHCYPRGHHPVQNDCICK